jgi:hypothetical protein|tara:strand:- start:517 stop:891 length:375 start_codon:yes stop_codon:yes gene_type:complete
LRTSLKFPASISAHQTAFADTNWVAFFFPGLRIDTTVGLLQKDLLQQSPVDIVLFAIELCPWIQMFFVIGTFDPAAGRYATIGNNVRSILISRFATDWLSDLVSTAFGTCRGVIFPSPWLALCL